MNANFYPITPKCGICKKFYSHKEDDDSGLCPKCRAANSQPLINKQKFNMEDIVEAGPYGVRITQMIAALKKAIQEGSTEKLRLLQKFYSFPYNKSLKYLKTGERAYIENHLTHH